MGLHVITGFYVFSLFSISMVPELTNHHYMKPSVVFIKKEVMHSSLKAKDCVMCYDKFKTKG